MHPVRNQKGVALLMVMFTVVILSFLAVEVSYEVGIEYRLSKNLYDDLKAKYAAKSGLNISLLRVAMYKNVVEQFGDQIPDSSMLDMIWNFPFSWPPSLPDESSLAAREELSNILEDTIQDTSWTAIIESEGNRVDLNDLNSPSDTLAKATFDKIYTILEQRLKQEDEWAQENRYLEIGEIVNNIKDWVDPDDESPHAGSESSLYSDLNSASGMQYPPNRDFKTIEELHMVAGVSDDIYEILKPNVTVYGIKGINVNYADKQQLMAIDSQMTDEIVSEIIKRRNDPELGPFKDLQQFEGFISGYGVIMEDFNKSEMPLRFDKEFNFRIQSIGMYGKSQKKYEAIVYDFTNAKTQLKDLLEKQAAKANQGQGNGDNNDENNDEEKNPSDSNASNNQNNQNNQENQNKKKTFDQGKPRIIYLRET